VVGAVEQAVEAHLVVVSEDGTGVQFAHALIREALYEGILPMRRRVWHRRAGERLAAEGQPDPDAVAYHFHAAGDARAYDWLIRAGDRAQRAYAWLMAATRFEAALAIAEGRGIDDREQAWLLMRIAAMIAFSTPARAVQIIADVAQRAERAGDRGLAAYAVLRQGFEMGQSGNPRGIALVEAGSAALDALTKDERAQLLADATRYAVPFVVAEGRSMLTYFYGSIGRLADAVRVGEPLLEHETNQYAYIGLAEAYDALGLPGRSRAMRERARDYAAARGLFSGVASNETSLLGTVLQYDTENLAERQRLVDAAMAAGVLAGGMRPAPRRVYGLAHLLIAGQWDAVLQVATGMDTSEDVPSFLRHHARLALLRVWVESGEPTRAWDLIRRSLPEGPEAALGSIIVRSAVPMQQMAAQLALYDADLPTVRDWLVANDRWLAWSGAVRGRSEGHALWGMYHRALGDSAAATEHAQQALAHATDPRQPLALLAAHRLLAELATDSGRYDEAVSHLDAALALADACAAPYERALSLLARAALHLTLHEQSAAAALIDEVRTICTPLAARPALARADALAARLAAPQPTRRTYPDGLTGREIEVLRLIAAGSTNQEIAESLFLSIRTVERHITTIYRKIDARGRADATAYAARHALLPGDPSPA
jgi:DNA-binding CsgD family transcriptional regulator